MEEPLRVDLFQSAVLLTGQPEASKHLPFNGNDCCYRHARALNSEKCPPLSLRFWKDRAGI